MVFLFLQPWVLLAVFAARALLAPGQLIPAHPRPVPSELLPSHYCCRSYSSQVEGVFICPSCVL